MLKNKKGITLISLVITIIVLLILAGVALNTIAGENGILEKAKQAREQSEASKDLEEMQLGLASGYIDQWVTGDSSKFDEAMRKLLEEDIVPKGLIRVEESYNFESFLCIIEYKEKLYKAEIKFDDSNIDPITQFLNNMQLVNANELKETYEVFLQMTYDGIWNYINNGVIIVETETKFNVLIEYNSKVYMYSGVYDPNTDIGTYTLEEAEGIMEKPELASISTGYCCKFGLDSNGHVWNLASDEYAININKLSGLENVVFTKISAGCKNVLMLDSNGKIWGYGNNEENQFGMVEEIESESSSYTVIKTANVQKLAYQPSYIKYYNMPVCISDIPSHPLNGIVITDMDLSKVDYNDGNYGVALDNTGKVYYWGYFHGYETFYQTEQESYTNNSNVYVQKVDMEAYEWIDEPTCINTLPNSTLADVTITKISAGYGHLLFLDSQGKIWSFGHGGYGRKIRGNEGSRYDFCMPRCINNFGMSESNKTEYTSLDGVVFKDISAGYRTSMAIDTEGYVWSWGYDYGDEEYICDEWNVEECSYMEQNYTVQKLDVINENESNIPVCLSKKVGNPLYGIKAQKISAGMWHSLVLDVSGKVWGWGDYEGYYRNEENYNDYIDMPELLGTESIEEIYNQTIIDICAGPWNSGMINNGKKYYLFGYFEEGGS